MQFKPFGLLILVASASAMAQLAPGAGNQIQQIAPPPVAPKPVPQLHVERAAEQAAPLATSAADAETDAETITVSRLRLTGHPAFSEQQLLAAAQFEPGAAMTLAQLRGMAARITAYYRARGYFLARAALPPQDVKGGVVTIAVQEGQYASVTLRNRSAVADSVAHALLGGLRRGDAALIAPLETRLLLLSDLPGVTVNSTLTPGAAPGSTDLIVDLARAPRVNGSIDADNHGNRYTGKVRIGATVNVNQLAGRGDLLTLRAMTSARGLNYGRLAYQMQAGRATAGIALARMDYELGRDFAALEAHGTADIASLYASYPLIRSRVANLNARIGLDAKKLRDRQDVANSVLDKKARVFTAALAGDRRDQGGTSRYAATLTAGSIDIGSPDALAADAASARTNGRYSKLAYSLSRLQQLAPDWALYGALSGQTSSTNLDASEKMGLGGTGAVRAYPEGEAYADRAAVLTVELKKTLALALPGQLQLVGFVDGGTATLDKSPWSAGRRHRSLRGAGVGIAWSGSNALVAKASVAHKLGGAAATSAPDQRYRVALEAVKYF